MTPGPFRRILVGWDCSPGAAAALAVLKPAPHTEEAAEGAADFDSRQRFAQETFAKACSAVPDAQRARVTLRFTQSSDPARTVCEYALQQGFGLLVLGRHGTGGVLHPRLGHVAATAARKGGLPVLLVP
jgi:nucleotide-binding universal stress UspA family protein